MCLCIRQSLPCWGSDRACWFKGKPQNGDLMQGKTVIAIVCCLFIIAAMGWLEVLGQGDIVEAGGLVS